MIEIREVKSTKVESVVAAPTVGSLGAFLRECRDAGLPADTLIFITHFTDAKTPHYELRAEHVVQSDNLPQAAS